MCRQSARVPPTTLRDLNARIMAATGDLLLMLNDDTELIEVLGTMKITASEVKEKLTNAAEANERISTAREEYRPVAFHAALLFFCVADMGSVNEMYQYSMPWFVNLYVKSIGPLM